MRCTRQWKAIESTKMGNWALHIPLNIHTHRCIDTIHSPALRSLETWCFKRRIQSISYLNYEWINLRLGQNYFKTTAITFKQATRYIWSEMALLDQWPGTRHMHSWGHFLYVNNTSSYKALSSWFWAWILARACIAAQADQPEATYVTKYETSGLLLAQAHIFPS